MGTASEPKPFQFTLWHLMLAVTVLCVLAGMMYWAPFLAVVGGASVCVFLLIGSRQWVLEALLVTCIFAALTELFWPAAWTPARQKPRPVRICGSNLKQLGLSLHMYHEQYGSLPPAYLADESGRPMHSWRVLLLPFFEQQALYDRYRFDEPWDGPNNRLLADEISRVYSCPADTKPLKTETSYVAVVGPGTAWPDEGTTSWDQIRDGMSRTIVIVEVHNSGIHWMEPRDLYVTQMPLAINPKRGIGISSLHTGGAMVVCADGSVHMLPSDLDAETLWGLLTIAGGEDVALPWKP
jgi:hypothetical protein